MVIDSLRETLEFSILSNVSMNRRPFLLIADEQILMAECLRSLLQPEFPNVGIAACTGELFESAVNHKPDLILMDIRLSLPGSDTIHCLKKCSAAAKIIIISTHYQPDLVAEVSRAGAAAFLLKSCAPDELMTAIRRVLEGHSYFCSSIGKGSAPIGKEAKVRPGSPILTPRQREVLELVAQGYTAKKIAQALHVSVKTAVFHKTALMEKLALRTTAELTRYALTHGIMSNDSNTDLTSASAAQSEIQAQIGAAL